MVPRNSVLLVYVRQTERTYECKGVDRYLAPSLPLLRYPLVFVVACQFLLSLVPPSSPLLSLSLPSLSSFSSNRMREEEEEEALLCALALFRSLAGAQVVFKIHQEDASAR